MSTTSRSTEKSSCGNKCNTCYNCFHNKGLQAVHWKKRLHPRSLEVMTYVKVVVFDLTTFYKHLIQSEEWAGTTSKESGFLTKKNLLVRILPYFGKRD